MANRADLIFAFALLVLATFFEYRYFWPRFRADTAAERAGARTRAYWRGVIGQWLFGIGALVIWTTYERPWSALRLALPTGWRLVLGVAFAVASLALLAVQLWSVLRLPQEGRVAVRPKLGSVAFMLPRTQVDEAWFIALSITAGFVEELLYRGYLPWLIAPWLGSIGAMGVIVLVFGASHIYQGRSGAIKATIAGAIMAAIVLATNSLIPAMIVHALVDIGGGMVGYYILREVPSMRDPAPGVLPQLEATG